MYFIDCSFLVLTDRKGAVFLTPYPCWAAPDPIFFKSIANFAETPCMKNSLSRMMASFRKIAPLALLLAAGGVHADDWKTLTEGCFSEVAMLGAWADPQVDTLSRMFTGTARVRVKSYPGYEKQCPCTLTVTPKGANLADKGGKTLFDGKNDSATRKALVDEVGRSFMQLKREDMDRELRAHAGKGIKALILDARKALADAGVAVGEVDIDQIVTAVEVVQAACPVARKKANFSLPITLPGDSGTIKLNQARAIAVCNALDALLADNPADAAEALYKESVRIGDRCVKALSQLAGAEKDPVNQQTRGLIQDVQKFLAETRDRIRSSAASAPASDETAGSAK